MNHYLIILGLGLLCLGLLTWTACGRANSSAGDNQAAGTNFQLKKIHSHSGRSSYSISYTWELNAKRLSYSQTHTGASSARRENLHQQFDLSEDDLSLVRQILDKPALSLHKQNQVEEKPEPASSSNQRLSISFKTAQGQDLQFKGPSEAIEAHPQVQALIKIEQDLQSHFIRKTSPKK